MFYADYATEDHLSHLDQEFDNSMANLNKLLDQVLINNPISDEANDNGPNHGYEKGHNNLSRSNPHQNEPHQSYTLSNTKLNPQLYLERQYNDPRNLSEGINQLAQYSSNVQKTDGYAGKLSNSPLDLKISQQRIHESPSNIALKRPQTERDESPQKDQFDLVHQTHQRWTSQQYSFATPPNEFFSARTNEDYGAGQNDWLKNIHSRGDSIQGQSKQSHGYLRSHTMSRASEDVHLQVSFHTDADAGDMNQGQGYGMNRLQNSMREQNVEMYRGAPEYENRFSGSKQKINMENNFGRHDARKPQVNLDNSYGLGANQSKQEDLVFNSTPKQQKYIDRSGTKKSISPNSSQLKSSFYKRPSIVQSPLPISPLATRHLSPQNSVQLSSNKKKGPPQPFDETMGDYERNMNYINRYTTRETIDSLDHFPAEKEALINSLTRSPKPLGSTSAQREHTENDEDDLLDKIVVMHSPAKDQELDKNLVSIYQQVSEVYDNGTKYFGEKLLGKRHGKGTYHFQEGYKYEGNWEQDKMSGFGTLWLTEDLKWYEGEWMNNLFHGRGSLYNLYPEPLDAEKVYAENFSVIENGWTKYEGQFDQGLKEGLGSFYLTNQDFYIGNFKQNQADGRGAYTKPDKLVVVGRWERNRLIETY